MPWIDKENCSGCGICIDECPTKAISVEKRKAEIDMSLCIRCGLCHDICGRDAIRHDSEKTADRIKDNVDETKRFMDECEKYLKDPLEKIKCLNRMKKHYANEIVINEKTLALLEDL